MTSISSIDPTGSSVLSASGGEFSDNAFLQLLITEMRTQSPTDPVDNASMMEQLASYSSMQQQQDLNQNMLQLLDYQGLLARLQGLSEGSSLLGKDVTYVDSTGNEHTGNVDSIFVAESGEVRLRVGDDEVDMRQVVAIDQPQNESETEA